MKNKFLFILSFILIFNIVNFSYPRRRRLIYIGHAETYGAPDIRLMVEMINECHFRMRYYYYLGVSKRSVMFGRYKIINKGLILIDGKGNRVRFIHTGIHLTAYDNGYRIYLKRTR